MVPDDTPVDQGGKVPGDGDDHDGRASNGEGGKPSDQNGDDTSSRKKDEGGAGDQVITASRLSGVLDARARRQDAELKRFQSTVESRIGEIGSKLEELFKTREEPKGDKKKDPKADDDSEKVELKRKVDELMRRVEDAETRASSEREEKRQYWFETKVQDALVKAGCRRPEQAFLIVKPHLRMDDDGTRIYATVDSEWGEEEVTVDDYIKRVVREDLCPEFFPGYNSGGGSPASGDEGGSGGGYKYTWEQVKNNPEFYAANREAIDEALRRGQVKGAPKPST